MKAPWTAPDRSLFFSKNDSADIRLGDCVQTLDPSASEPPPADLLLWGYPDDEGIRLNGGRVGAAEAPKSIRTVFYKMTPDVLSGKTPRLLDGGDISLELALGQRHDEGSRRAEWATRQGLSWASFGGGHDYGYADGSGFLRAHQAQAVRPLILNFDAHLDVRPSDKGLNSGTPFFRLISEFPDGFDFFEIGLQPHCNSRSHWQWALDHKAHLIPLLETQKKGLLPLLQSILLPFVGRPLWLSLDIDAITSTEAPGCSQSWTTGLRTVDLMESFQWLMESFSWKAFSIYEVSPPLDSDNRTAKLAAQFLHRYLSLAMDRS